MFVGQRATSPMMTDPPFSSPMNANNRFSQQSEDTANKPPSFLFGANKRRSLAISQSHNPYLSTPPTSGASESFASPIPSHMRDSVGSGKNVHWSPALVQEKSIGEYGSSKPAASFGSGTKGPPLRSLRDEIDQPPSSKLMRRHTLREPSSAAAAIQQSPAAFANTSHNITATTATSQNDTTAADNNAADCWVTVFGFSPGEASTILKYFSRHGEVIQHKFPAKGNWVHLRYSCSIHAGQALSRNGHVIDGSMMVGVVPCTDKSILGEGGAMNRSSMMNRTMDVSIAEAEESRTMNRTMPAITPNPRDENLDSSMNNSRMSMASRTGMRSLAAAYNAVDQYTSHPTKNPEKDQGLMSKLWNFVGSV